MCYDTSKLDPLVGEYNSTMTKMTDLVDNYISLKRRGKEVKPKMVRGGVRGCGRVGWGVRVCAQSRRPPLPLKPLHSAHAL